MCQYIPCYCSSDPEKAQELAEDGVNTSHVIVHHFSSFKGQKAAGGVNTSHVIVHPLTRRSHFIITSVSIHPMLLFIVFTTCFSTLIGKCQYIPCYCSSCAVQMVCGIILMCQYIPCYCSSHDFKAFLIHLISLSPLF